MSRRGRRAVDIAGATPEERREFRVHDNEIIADRFRAGVPAAIALDVVLAAVSLVTHAASVEVIFGVFAAVALVLVCAWPLLRSRRVRRTPLLVVAPVSMVVAAAMGVGVAAAGGLMSIASAIYFLISVYGAAVTPLPPAPFAVVAASHQVVFLAAVYVASDDPGQPWWFITISVGVQGLCAVGLVFREWAELRAFVSQRRLNEAHQRLGDSERSLAALNCELEARVDAQVGEIIRHSVDIDALNAQLQQRVRERSHELALALARIAERASNQPGASIHAGTILAERARIIRLLAAGGMGEVYLADDLVTGRNVVVKVIHSRQSTSKQDLYRFFTEAAAAAAITHPGIVKTLHVDVASDGTLFQIIEYVAGQTLSQRLRAQRSLTVAASTRLGAAVAHALTAAHAAGVIHRDLKPSNLILTSTPPGVRILDFGLAKIDRGSLQPPVEQTQLTEANAIMGTPAYMSPEQVRDASSVTVATDVYSLGVILYETVAGRSPYDADSAASYYAAHASAVPHPLTSARSELVPSQLERMIVSCLSKEPPSRPSAAQLAIELTALVSALDARPLEADYEAHDAVPADAHAATIGT